MCKALLKRIGLTLAGLLGLLLISGCPCGIRIQTPPPPPIDMSGTPFFKSPAGWKAIPVPPVTKPGLNPAEDRITERNNQIADLKAQIAKLAEENKQEEARQRREAEARIRAVLYWASVVAFGLAAVATVLCFIPILALFRKTAIGLAAGFTAVGFVAIGLAPTIQYAGWVVGSLAGLSLVGGLIYLVHLYRAGMAGKIAAHAADTLEQINPLDTDALRDAKREIQQLQKDFRVGTLTEGLRERVRIPAILDKALKGS